MQTKSINLQLSDKPIFRVLPAFLMMLAIFLFSAHPGPAAPLSLVERILYKGGHVVGYALLSLSYWRAFGFQPRMRPIAWLVAVLYAVTDEYHQSFVPGRHPTPFDVLVYDNLGAIASLWLANHFLKQKQPAPERLVVEHPKQQ